MSVPCYLIALAARTITPGVTNVGRPSPALQLTWRHCAIERDGSTKQRKHTSPNLQHFSTCKTY